MKNAYSFVAFCALLFFLPKFAEARQQSGRPQLVVTIIVDQMRWDYLHRYEKRYGKGGFKRLMRQGFNCQQTYINYFPAFTAPGHASIATGSVPALHGIVANDWIDRFSQKSVYCVGDSTVNGVGAEVEGSMSPRNLLATTVADELRLATNFRSRTMGVSLKDRCAVLPVGHTANAAYWYDGKSGKFITSTFYQSQLPAWLVQFNDRKVPDSLMQQSWNTLYPIHTYLESTADSVAYEWPKKDGSAPVFPHKSHDLNDKSLVRYTMFGNILSRMMAEACIAGEQLGKGTDTDFFSLNFASADYVGHQFGPNSVEMEDTYLRLDKEIELLLNFLDRQIGDGNYLLMLTADHGGSHNGRFLRDHNIPGGSVSIRKLNRELNQYLFSLYGDSTLSRSLTNYQVHLNENTIKEKNLDRQQLKAAIRSWLLQQNGITNVLDLEHPENNLSPEIIRDMLSNSYLPSRCGTMEIILNPGWYSSSTELGTSHGGWNPYDTRVPLLWYGWNIKPGATHRRTSITDIAATLAALLNIQVPNACVGTVITEVLQQHN
jgi:predicted AlkP superfamily pyrophosphatase or phosphodiesterase